MSYTVYIIINTDKKPFYTYVGFTKDIKNRLKKHNTSRGAKFTRGRLWKLIYKEKYELKIDAMRNEYILKKDKNKRKKIKINYLKKENLLRWI